VKENSKKIPRKFQENSKKIPRKFQENSKKIPRISIPFFSNQKNVYKNIKIEILCNSYVSKYFL
jgi:hypothetical protein